MFFNNFILFFFRIAKTDCADPNIHTNPDGRTFYANKLTGRFTEQLLIVACFTKDPTGFRLNVTNGAGAAPGKSSLVEEKFLYVGFSDADFRVRV